MFQLKNIIYIHNTSRPTTKQPEPDYNTGTIMSERYDAQKNTNVAVSVLWQVGMSLVFIIHTSKFI